MKILLLLSMAFLVGCDSGASPGGESPTGQGHTWHGTSYVSYKGDTTSMKIPDTFTVQGSEGSFSSGHKLENVFYVNKKWYGKLISWGKNPAKDVFIATENSTFDYMINAQCTLSTEMVFYFKGSE